MGNLIFNMLNTIYGSSLYDVLITRMSKVLNVAIDVWGNCTDAVSILSAIACSFLIIYFFMDLTNQASKDMFSLEKLVVAFIRLLVAFCVLLFLSDFISYALQLGDAFLRFMDEQGKNIAAGANVTNQLDDSVRDTYVDYFSGVHLKRMISGIACIVILFIPYAIAGICRLVGFFISMSTAIMLIVKAIFSPIAVVQIFEEGTRSSGIRYLKGLFADCLSFAVIVGILYVGQIFSSKMVNSAGIDVTDPESVTSISWESLLSLLVPNLVCVGGMASGSKIAHEIMGA